MKWRFKSVCVVIAKTMAHDRAQCLNAQITEPYIYEGKMIIEHTYPIIIDGQFKGVARIDRSLNAILTFIAQIKLREGVDIFLISRLGSFIAANSNNRDDLVTKPIDFDQIDSLFNGLQSRL
jgi:hypothetical protein